MRVLLLSAYDAHSHRAWHQALIKGIADWEWQLLCLPPRHFSWRIRGNALYWASAERPILEAGYDLVVATSMVDLATLRGLVPALGQIPTVLYFHENQFAYPSGRSRHGLLDAQMVTLYSALAADQLLFNSRYNQETFLLGCQQMLDRFPDKVPAGIADRLRARSAVLPVPVAAPGSASTRAITISSGTQAVLQILWNHRWEYDKGVDELLALARALVSAGVKFNLHVVGQQFRQQPGEFAQLRQLLQQANAGGQWGYIENQSQYYKLLANCDVVLSTAHHDFQGLAVLEACLAGCTPLLPARVVYPEWFGDEYLYKSVSQAVDRLAHYSQGKALGRRPAEVPLADFSPATLLPRYRALFIGQLAAN